MRTLRYATKLLRCLVLSRMFWAVLVVAMTVAALPLTRELSMYAGAALEDGRALARENLTVKQESLESSGLDQLPDLHASVEREVAALDAALSSKTTREYCQHMVDYVTVQIEQLQSGYLDGPTSWGLDAELCFYRSLAQEENPQIFASTADMPGLMYVSFVFARGVTFVWTAIPLASMALLLLSSCREKLLGVAPVSRMTFGLTSWALAVLVGVLGLLAAFLPSFLLASMAHGIGELSYPIVFTMHEQVVQMTLGTLLMRQLALYVLASAFLAATELFVYSLTKRPAIAVVFAFAVSAMTIVSAHAGLSGEADEARAFLAALPTTYLDFGSVAGYPLFFFEQQIPAIEGTSFSRGVATLSVGAAVLVAGGLVVRAIVSASRAHRRRGRRARA